MFVKRVIPCITVENGRAVTNVEQGTDIDAIELAQKYASEGADAVVFRFNDMETNFEGVLEFIRTAAREVGTPLAVGDVTSVGMVDKVVAAGAFSVVTSLHNEDFLYELYEEFGSRKIVACVDVEERDGNFFVGEQSAITYIRNLEQLNVGQILLFCVEGEEKVGVNIPLLSAAAKAVSVPIIAGAGVAKLADYKEAINAGADAVLGTMFQFGQMEVADLKMYLMSEGIVVRYKTPTRG